MSSTISNWCGRNFIFVKQLLHCMFCFQFKLLHLGVILWRHETPWHLSANSKLQMKKTMNYIQYVTLIKPRPFLGCDHTFCFTVWHYIQNLLDNGGMRPSVWIRHDAKGIIGFGNQDTRNRPPHDLYTTLTYLAHVCQDIVPFLTHNTFRCASEGLEALTDVLFSICFEG